MTLRETLSKIFRPLRQNLSPSLAKLIEHTHIVAEAGTYLNDILHTDPDKREELHSAIVQLEKQADQIQHEAIEITMPAAAMISAIMMAIATLSLNT